MIDTLRVGAGSVPAQVTFAATVDSFPHEFVGRITHARHEEFSVHQDDGRRLRIIDNIDLAPPIPVRPGDRIVVRGELVHDRNGEPVVHWTHHDPAARHPGGWIELAGRRYA
jgi:hypothetical protein